jgi:hypothetical protein
VFIVRGVELRRRTVLAYVTIVIVAYVGFLLYPTLAPRPALVAGEDIFAWSLRQLYDFDPPYNCFPSLHVAYSFLAALTAWTVHRPWISRARMGDAHRDLDAIHQTALHHRRPRGDHSGGRCVCPVPASLPRTLVSEDTRQRAPRRALPIPAIFALVVVGFWIGYVNQ